MFQPKPLKLRSLHENKEISTPVLFCPTNTILVIEHLSNGNVSDITSVTPRHLYSYIKLNVSNFAEKTTGRQGLSGEPLNMRDIRKLQQPFTSKNQPAIIVRLYCVLLNFDPLRAIILNDRMIVLVPVGADSVLDQLSKLLHGSEESDNDDLELLTDRTAPMQTFPFRAIESVMSVVVANMQNDLSDIAKRTNELLDIFEQLRSKVDFETLEMLKSLKNEVATEEARATMTKTALDEILSDDEDMALLGFSQNNKSLLDSNEFDAPEAKVVLPVKAPVYLSLSDCEPISGTHPATICIEDHEPFEILFERMLQAVITIQTSITLISREIANGEQFHLLHLTTARNKLLSASVMFSIVSMFTSMGGLVGSFYGMNLVNGYESSDKAFEVICYITSAAVVILTLFVFLALRWTGVLYGSSSY